MSDWVFLRGLARESRHWESFPEHFRERIPDARIHAPDLPGNGLRNGERTPLRIEAMAERCRLELRGLGLTPPYRLLGLSMGAMAALAWAARYPEEVAACVLLNTSLAPVNPFHQRLRPGAWLPLLATLLPGLGAEYREGLILALTSRRGRDEQPLLQRWSAYRRERPVAAANALRQLVAAARFRTPAPGVPCLFLAGHGDRLVDCRCSRRLALAWNADFAEHPAAGHDLTLDDCPWVAAQVADWITSSSLGSAAPERR